MGERVGFVWVAYLLFPAVLGALSAFKPSSKLPKGGSLMGPRLRVECGATGETCRVWLDDQEISKFTYSVKVDLSPGDATRATIGVFVDHLDLGFNGDVEVLTPLLKRSQ